MCVGSAQPVGSGPDYLCVCLSSGEGQIAPSSQEVGAAPALYCNSKSQALSKSVFSTTIGVGPVTGESVLRCVSLKSRSESDCVCVCSRCGSVQEVCEKP